MKLRKRSAADPGGRLERIARRMALDHACAEVSTAFAASGVPCLLLKGPAIARTLYRDGVERDYRDIDILVDPVRHAEAEGVLGDLWFSRAGNPEARHHTGWIRRAAVEIPVELHSSLFWTSAAAALTWKRLDASAEPIALGGTTVRIPGPAGRLLVIALHAAQHGRRRRHVLEDLRRAARTGTRSEWEAAAGLARELGAELAFAAGLRLDPAGRRLAEELSLADGASRELRIHLASSPHTSLGFERLARTAGAGPRLRLLAAEFLPTPDFLRAWKPIADRGPVGLALAYAWRPVWLCAHAPIGLIAWRRANRRALHTGR